MTTYTCVTYAPLATIKWSTHQHMKIRKVQWVNLRLIKFCVWPVHAAACLEFNRMKGYGEPRMVLFHFLLFRSLRLLVHHYLTQDCKIRCNTNCIAQ